MIEIANDGGLKSVFEQTSLAGFWIKTKAEYPEISIKALKTLLQLKVSSKSILQQNNS